MPKQPRDPVTQQFMEVRKPEQINVDLDPLDGSFRYPPAMRNLDDIVQFWSKVEIPDEAVEEWHKVYEATYDRINEVFANQTWTAVGARLYEEAYPKPDTSDPGALAAWEGKLRETELEYVREYQSVLEARPRKFPEDLARKAIRAAGIVHTARETDDVDLYIRSRAVVLRDNNGEEMTTELLNRYGAAGFARFVLDQEQWGTFDAKVDEATSVARPLNAQEVRAIVQAEIKKAIDASQREIVKQVRGSEGRIQQQNKSLAHQIMNQSADLGLAAINSR